MQEAEEQDTCRICSAPADDEQPLFHPCKCSGTIRYIHQDCLTTWLAHSKKKSCDVCKHPYSFTKVYASDMPSSLPLILVVRRLLQQALFALLFVLRAVAVAVIWLGVLPWATVWTWRMYFSMGESAARWISERPLVAANEATPFYYTVSTDASVPSSKNIVSRLTSHPLWVALSADIFMGQIIASLIVLTFVAIFLLREWISQNARPGIFEDEEVLPEEQAAPQAHVEPQAQPPAQDARLAEIAQLDQALAQRQIEALRAIDALRTHEGVNGHMVGSAKRHNKTYVERPRRKAKGRERIADLVNQPELDGPARTRRKLFVKGSENRPVKDVFLKRRQKQAWSHHVHAARRTGVRRRAALTARGESPLKTLPVDSSFEFTFKASSGSPPQRSSSEPWDSTRTTTHNEEPLSASTLPTTPVFPNVTLELSKENVPFSFSGVSTPSSSSPRSVLEIAEDQMNSPASVDSITRRPTLPITAIPTMDPVSSFVQPISDPSGFNLATYRAPEELAEDEAGPSNWRDRLDSESRESGSEIDSGEENPTVETEMDHYFVEPNGTENTAVNFMNLSDDDEKADASDNEDQESYDDGTPLSDGIDENEYEDENNEEDEDEPEGEIGDDVGDDPDANVVGDNWQIMGLEEGQVANGGVPAQAEPAVEQQGANQGQADGGAGGEANDELEGNVEDDMEGAMEAIGMRGPVYGVFQNAALMIFVLDTAIAIGVWIPFIIGKSTALLMLNPPRFLQILHLPIRAIRIITDPIVDSIAFFIISILFPPFIRLIRHLGAFIYFVLPLLGNKASKGNQESKLTGVLSKLESHLTLLTVRPLEKAFALISSSPRVEKLPKSESILYIQLPPSAQKLEYYFALLGKEVRLGSVYIRDTWTRLALGDGPRERLFAVLLGYTVLGLLLAVYLNILTVGNAKTAGKAVRSAVRQQLLVLKVAAFIFIELVTFPFACGVVLDLCTVWLFPDSNLTSRAAFFFQAPLTAMFYHWIAGTMFMYSFAVLLPGCRSVIRPGAMWFIKDPQDQNSHPIRDILDRPTLTQLRKICISGVMYACVVACVVGSVAGLLLLGNKSIMPFRWKTREPLSNVPIDLLFLHIVLPHTMHYFRPKKALKHLATAVWKAVAARLRLTSYFFGGRHHDEEYTPKHWRAFSFRLAETVTGPDTDFDGLFRRVPATDHLALPRDMRATAAVTEDGLPVDDAAKELMDIQNAEAEKAKRNIKDDYMIVYIPPHFRYRILSFIALLWTIGAIFLGMAVALPIQLGRSVFELFTSREVHDGYALIVGFYMIWGCCLVGAAIDRLERKRRRSRGDSPHADILIFIVKRSFLWVAKATYMAVFLGIIIPTLISLVIELYIILPIRLALDPAFVPVIRIVDTWALGLLYIKIGIHANRFHPPNRISRGIQHILNNGWSKPDPIVATKEVIGPITGGLLGMVIFPGAAFQAIRYMLPNLPVDDKFIFMHIYPSIFMFAGMFRSAVVLYGLTSSWSQAIRDKEFLVELRLRNHEPDRREESDMPTPTKELGAEGVDARAL